MSDKPDFQDDDIAPRAAPAKATLPQPPRGPLGLLNFLFGLSTDVTPLAYAVTGFSLAILKYAVEAGVIHHFTGKIYTPTDFLNPLLSMRQEFFKAPAPDWLTAAMLWFTLPFLWISVSMSVRRAANAGMTAWFGLLVLLPGLNYLIMVVLCFLPHRYRLYWASRRAHPKASDKQVQSALLGVVSGTVLSITMVLVGVYLFQNYGAALSIGTPVIIGAVSAFIYNRPFARDLFGSLVVAQLSIAISGAALLLFAFEGLICLLMLYPIAAAMGLLGGFIGYAVGALTSAHVHSLPMVILLLPLLMGAEKLHTPSPLYEVETILEIDAPPEKVWPHVIGFSELADPPAWYFKLGIAYPKRATIKGSGVGAIRHCEFSTGAFVEPVTAWEPPHRLAFDVASQPPPMHELSPYRHVHPPHLDGYLKCQRGEFRLVPLPNGRTRLEGSKWYEFKMYPQDYWTIWSDMVIHRIHGRVLNHIKGLAEAK